MTDSLLLLAGLGNPGEKYARHRHNVGFMAVDAIAARHRFSPYRPRYHGEVAEGTIGGRKTLILKPMTYMNESGMSVGQAARYLKVPLEAIVVIHDEADLVPGKIRAKVGGSDAGHNGHQDHQHRQDEMDGERGGRESPERCEGPKALDGHDRDDGQAGELADQRRDRHDPIPDSKPAIKIVGIAGFGCCREPQAPEASGHESMVNVDACDRLVGHS